MKPTPSKPKPPPPKLPSSKTRVTAEKPKPKPEPVIEYYLLLDENKQLKHTISVLERHLKETQMATATAAEPKPKVEAKMALGNILQYQPKEPGATPVTAIVMAVHDDGSCDVKAFMGYCLGTTDVEKVPFGDDAEEGKVSKLGAKPKEPEPVDTSTEPPPHKSEPRKAKSAETY